MEKRWGMEERWWVEERWGAQNKAVKTGAIITFTMNAEAYYNL